MKSIYKLVIGSFLICAASVQADTLAFQGGETFEFSVGSHAKYESHKTEEKKKVDLKGKEKIKFVFDIAVDEAEADELKASVTLKKIDISVEEKVNGKKVKLSYSSKKGKVGKGEINEKLAEEINDLIGKVYTLTIPLNQETDFSDLDIYLLDQSVCVPIGRAVTEIFRFTGQELKKGELIETDLLAIIDSGELKFEKDAVKGDPLFEYQVKKFGRKHIYATTNSKIETSSKDGKLKLYSKGKVVWKKGQALDQKREMQFKAESKTSEQKSKSSQKIKIKSKRLKNSQKDEVESKDLADIEPVDSDSEDLADVEPVDSE